MNRILIVEDEHDNLQQLGRLIQSLSWESTAISSGPEALALIESGEILPYSAIVLDLVMPEVDGFMILAALQQMNSRIPVIVSVKQSSVADVNTALRLGAWDFITRPYSSERVQVSIRNAIRHYAHIRAKANAVMDGQTSVRVLDSRGRIQAFELLEEQIFKIAHHHSGGHISEMARKLNIGRSTLYRKLKKFGMETTTEKE